MGLKIGFSSDSGSSFYQTKSQFHFLIKEIIKYDHCTLAILKYEREIPFNGIKIIVFRGHYDLCTGKEVDPHFLSETEVVARFRPTVQGLKMAQRFCEDYIEEYNESDQSYENAVERDAKNLSDKIRALGKMIN